MGSFDLQHRTRIGAMNRSRRRKEEGNGVALEVRLLMSAATRFMERKKKPVPKSL
jgi:hypothetical protein